MSTLVRRIVLALVFAPGVAGAQEAEPQPQPEPESQAQPEPEPQPQPEPEAQPQPGAAPVYYGQPVPPPAPPPAVVTAEAGRHLHDGFYLRLFGGVNGMKVNGVITDARGGGVGLGVALGGALTRNLILYGEVYSNSMGNPKVESGGDEIETENTTAAVSGLGAGLAYYLMPLNMYVSGTFGWAGYSVKVDGDETFESGPGPAISLMMGKEWWLSHDWGLGVAGQLMWAAVGDDETGEKISASAFTLALSATYN